MISYNDILGLPIVDNYNNIIGIVKDVSFTRDTKVILGIIIQQKGLFGSAQYTSIDNIKKISKLSVKIDDIKQVRTLETYDYNENMQNNCDINTEVYTKKGNKIGYVKDILFNFETGLIDSFIIGDGFIEDLINGRKIAHNKDTEYKKHTLYILDTD